jgi:hypothetical protein
VKPYILATAAFIGVLAVFGLVASCGGPDAGSTPAGTSVVVVHQHPHTSVHVHGTAPRPRPGPRATTPRKTSGTSTTPRRSTVTVTKRR